jgi:plastocyanin
MINSLVRRTLAATAGTVLLAVASGAVAQQVAAARSAEISIENFSFTPTALTVAPGTTVTWVNNDEEPHNIVNADAGQPRLFRSQGLDGGDKYTFVFDKAGTYKYICSVHPRMEGTIVVK